jgi:hypothetical protein
VGGSAEMWEGRELGLQVGGCGAIYIQCWLDGPAGVGRREVARGQSSFAESPINGSRRRFFFANAFN